MIYLITNSSKLIPSPVTTFDIGKADILNRAAPIGINVISSLAPFTASSSGNTPQVRFRQSAIRG